MKRTVALPVLCLVVGILIGWWIHRPVSIRETPAPAMALPSGGVVAPRMEPPAQLPVVAKEAAKATGGKPVRVGHVTVQPTNQILTETELVDCTCDPVRIDWSLIEAKDGFRMAFDTPSGVIVDSSDRPLTGIKRHSPKPWAVGGTVSLDRSGRKHYGVFLDRDLGPFRLGVEASQQEGGTVTLRAGIKF